MRLRHSNRRWVICFSRDIQEEDASNHNLHATAELFIRHQVNLILICFDLNPKQRKVAEAFIARLKQLSADKVIPVEAFLLENKSPEQVREVMVKRVANFEQPTNAPLIIETFV